MKKKLRQELRKLSTEIITSDELEDVSGLYESAKNLYEKLTVLKYIEEKLHDVEVDVSKNMIASKFEKMANVVLSANSSVPESNPHEEDIIVPGMDTIKDMVSEMPESSAHVDEMLADFLSKPDYMKNDKELFMPRSDDGPRETKIKSLNDKLAGTHLKVDLNNRLAFVKHLFNGSAEDYNRVVSQLNTIDTEERSISFVTNMVKPDYNNWSGKEEFEERFMEFIIRKFS